jgi:hypothetical protein
MRNTTGLRTVLTVLGVYAALIASAPAGENSSSGGGGTVVIGEKTPLRTHIVYRTPMVAGKDGKIKVAVDIGGRGGRGKKKGQGNPYPEYQTALPPSNWREAEFDDSVWPIGRTPFEVETPFTAPRKRFDLHLATRNSMICVRGKFHVDDPKGVRGLKLDVEYVGGVAVYVNGKEVERAHLPEGELKPATLAEKYPDDLCVDAAGNFLQVERLDRKRSYASKFTKNEAEAAKNRANYERRYRRLSGVEIDSGMLRKGENVLALLIYRAPVNEGATKAKIINVGGMRRRQGLYPYAGLKSLRLTAPAGSALKPNNGAPKGIRIWNCMPFETVSSLSWGDGGCALKPVKIFAVRNGLFSGRVVISSDSAITGLKAGVSELAHEKDGTKLSREQVVLRVAAPATRENSWMKRGTRYDALLEKIPGQVPVVKAVLKRHSDPVATGAVAPLWVTVRVPADARPGLYRGKLTVEAAGLPKTEVPLEVKVHDWKLPDPGNFETHNLAVMTADNPAMYYKAPLWSERHWKLLGECFKLMKEVGSRNVEIDLAADYHGVPGNSQSLVRWIKDGKGGYRHDYTILEKYLEVVKEHVGKPRPLRLNCWPATVKGGKMHAKFATTVTLLDPKTGKLERIRQPNPGTDESYKFWKPVIDGVRERVRKHGWEDAISMGHQAYCWAPSKEMVDVCHKIWPEAVWSYTAHNGTMGKRWAGSNGVKMLVRYSECVWTNGNLDKRGAQKLLSRKDKTLIWNSVARGTHRDTSPLSRLRQLPEEMLLRGHNGVGQLGAGFFPLKNGRRTYMLDRGRGGLGPECSTRNILAPGPEGPVVTERFEMFREGVQLCEAIIYIEKALMAKKISGDLAARANAYLDKRGRAHVEAWWAGQYERDQELLELVAEVAKAAGN